MEPIIKTKDLSLVYDLGKSNETTALKDVNIEIYPEEYVVIFGPSGCGKSTLLYCLAGLEEPTSGNICVENKCIQDLSHKQMVEYHRSQVGMIFQSYHLIPTLSVLDNVALPQIFEGSNRLKREKIAKDLLKHFGVLDQAQKRPTQLSGGQQQRVAISRAMVNNPLIIFADEPVGNLDSKSAEVVLGLLQQLNEQHKKTIILVTHDPQAIHYAHRVIHMKDGQVIKETRNPKKKSIAPKGKEITPSSVILESLASSYPELSESALKAKALAQFIITDFEQMEINRLEEIIEKRIKNELDRQTLSEALDLPFEKGGVGLYKQTANNITKRIEAILNESEYLKKEIKIRPESITTLDMQTKHLRIFLLDKYDGQMNFEQIARLEKFIKMRLMKEINSKQFKKSLDISFKKGGAGLKPSTAKHFTRRLEMALLNYKPK